MQPIEFFEELREDLKALDWPDTVNSVFGNSVHVVPSVPIDQINSFRVPIAFIVDTGAKPYINNPELIEQAFSIHIFTSNHNDAYGEAVMLGANRTAGESSGAGLLDLEEVLIDSLIDKTSLNSKKITFLSKSKIKQREARGNAPFHFRELAFSALLSYGENSEREEIMISPGKLYWNPSDIPGGSFGTELGFLENGVQVYPDYDLFEHNVQDSGTITQGIYYRGLSLNISTDFLRYNSSTVARIFPGTTSGTSVVFPGSLKTGNELSSSQTGQLLFLPDDRTKNNIWHFYKVLAISGGPIDQSRGSNTTYRCNFIALLDGSSRMFFHGRLADFP